MYGAQATGCNPITDCVKTGRERHKPVRKPNTICKSLAIGDPADGYFAAKLIRETGGWGEDVTDDEIVEAMLLLAQTEGIFAETAGGVTLAVARKLIEQGRIPRDEEIVLCITGNGLKTQDAVFEALEEPATITPTLTAFEATGRDQQGRTGAGVKRIHRRERGERREENDRNPSRVSSLRVLCVLRGEIDWRAICRSRLRFRPRCASRPAARRK